MDPDEQQGLSSMDPARAASAVQRPPLRVAEASASNTPAGKKKAQSLLRNTNDAHRMLSTALEESDSESMFKGLDFLSKSNVRLPVTFRV